ncbi:hypothetical protein, partial [Enterobacter hormaechei]|uniref:hypothetical protein n=1 Tax=Enterobacter hormaechei TaxID=158836 RepID=UPI001953F10B
MNQFDPLGGAQYDADVAKDHFAGPSQPVSYGTHQFQLCRVSSLRRTTVSGPAWTTTRKYGPPFDQLVAVRAGSLK